MAEAILKTLAYPRQSWRARAVLEPAFWDALERSDAHRPSRSDRSNPRRSSRRQPDWSDSGQVTATWRRRGRPRDHMVRPRARVPSVRTSGGAAGRPRSVVHRVAGVHDAAREPSRADQPEPCLHAGGQGAFAATDDHGAKEQLDLVDESGGERLSAKLRAAYGQVHVAALLELPDQSRSVRVRALVTDVRVSENTILSAARQSDPIISTNLLVRRTLVR